MQTDDVLIFWDASEAMGSRDGSHSQAVLHLLCIDRAAARSTTK